MKLGEFIQNFITPNSLIRLVYKHEGGHEIVLESWDDVSMEWEVLKGEGKNRHYINSEVVGIVCIGGMKRYADAINIEIEELANQPYVAEPIEKEKCFSETISKGLQNFIPNVEENTSKNILKHDCYWVDDEWIQPPVRIKHGDLVEIKHAEYVETMLGRYIGKGYGVVELYNYATGIKHIVGKVYTRGLDENPRLISDEKLFEFIKD